MKDRLLALEGRKANLEQMAEPEPMPRLHPKLAEVYRQHVERLEEALNDSTIRPEAVTTNFTTNVRESILELRRASNTYFRKNLAQTG